LKRTLKTQQTKPIQFNCWSNFKIWNYLAAYGDTLQHTQKDILPV